MGNKEILPPLEKANKVRYFMKRKYAAETEDLISTPQISKLLSDNA